jgi:hypothetical protein
MLTEKHDSRKVTTAPNGDAQSAEFVYTLSVTRASFALGPVP